MQEASQRMEYEKAQDNFYKAKNYKDTAEVYTLLAWSYSFLNDLEKANSLGIY